MHTHSKTKTQENVKINHFQTHNNWFTFLCMIAGSCRCARKCNLMHRVTHFYPNYLHRDTNRTEVIRSLIMLTCTHLQKHWYTLMRYLYIFIHSNTAFLHAMFLAVSYLLAGCIVWATREDSPTTESFTCFGFKTCLTVNNHPSTRKTLLVFLDSNT